MWQHQLSAIEKAKARDDFGLFFEVGTGKTATAINILREWCVKENRILSALVLCPPIVIDQWGEEIKRFSKLGAYIVPLKGPGTKRAKTLKEATGPRIFITNYETLNMSECFKLLSARKFDVLIADESHKLKSGTAKRTKQTIALSDTVKRKIIMTGTPILQSPLDLWSQFRVLDGGQTFGKNFFVFRATYFYDKNANMPKHNYFPDWRLRPKVEQRLNELVYSKAVRAKKEECLDLPPLLKVEVPVEMSPRQKKVYEEMENELVVFMNEHGGQGVATVDLALTKVLRLQQIVSGFLPTMEDELSSEAKIHAFEDNPRADALRDLLEDLAPAHKVIVWASFHQNYQIIRGICERLGIGYVEIHGQRTAKQKEEAIQSFRTDDNVRVCIANQKAGGVGLNLTEASYSIYYSRGYALEDDIQSEARNYRGGSERHSKITRIDLVCRGSIDDVVLDALKNKQNIAEKILDLPALLTLACKPASKKEHTCNHPNPHPSL